MKKQIKILTTILMAIIILTTVGNVVLGVNNVLSQLSTPSSNIETTGITTLGQYIVGILQVVGIVVAVVVLLVLGIKYMMGSTEEKAKYKEVMIPYIVGALLIFAATTIVGVLFSMFSGINVNTNNTVNG